MTEKEPYHSPFSDLSLKDARFMQMMWGSDKFSINQLLLLQTIFWLTMQATSGKFACDVECEKKFAVNLADLILELADDIRANDKRGG